MNPTKRLERSWRGFATPALCVMTLVLVSWTPCQASEEGSNNPAHVNASTDSGEYRLAPGDKLNVIVFDQPQLSGDFTVNGDGQILLPLAGAVKVDSLKPRRGSAAYSRAIRGRHIGAPRREHPRHRISADIRHGLCKKAGELSLYLWRVGKGGHRHCWRRGRAWRRDDWQDVRGNNGQGTRPTAGNKSPSFTRA